MSQCKGCYRSGFEDYCPTCRKALFDGARVSSVLDFDAPKDETLPLYQEKTKRLSISGVQLKYSLRLEGNKLVLTEKGGQYIIKPVPPAVIIQKREQAPENEHLTMQLASKIFKIQTAANALIYFKDGTPAYITRRFDLKKDGSKYLQEDMAQISGKTRQSTGENFKYEGSYQDIGHLIQKHVAAYQPAMENYFRLVLFNYLFSNGDAHLKNFSLYRTDIGDYTLTPAYDIMSTALHMPNETDTALDLYTGDLQGEFYLTYGYFGQAAFRMLAEKIGMLPIRTERILTQMLSSKKEVLEFIEDSFLNGDSKKTYIDSYLDKLTRMGVTATMIGRIIDPIHPGVYAATNRIVTLTFNDKTKMTGHFDYERKFEKFQKENKYGFVEHALNQGNKVAKQVSIVDGDLLVSVELQS